MYVLILWLCNLIFVTVAMCKIRGLAAGLNFVKDDMYCAQNYEISDHHHFIKPLSSILPPFPAIVLI